MPLQATSGAASQDAFGGNGVAVVPTYIEDIFSCFLYTGNGSTQTITNNIDLATKGGLVWIKHRSGTGDHGLTDTVRGATKSLFSNQTYAELTGANDLKTFNNNGFSIGDGTQFSINYNTGTYASWTFRKQPKFFDIVTYTGDGNQKAIAHNLGSAPGFIIAKATSTTGAWAVWHRSTTFKQGYLNTTADFTSAVSNFPTNAGTSTTFTVNGPPGGGILSDVGVTYVAYLFAHDAGGFGLTGTDNVISCGSFTSSVTGTASITLGYEPQWVMIKCTTTSDSWYITDTMRGMPAGPATNSPYLVPNTAAAEASWGNVNGVNATGWSTAGLPESQTFIYIAIRRGPMKVPTTGTSVFTPAIRTGTSATANITSAGFPVDLALIGRRNTDGLVTAWDRLRGAPLRLITSNSNAESSTANGLTGFDSMTGFALGANNTVNDSTYNYVDWDFRRAPSFFDEVCYTGTGVARTVSHNLAAVPELMIVKKRSAADAWFVYPLDPTKYMELDSTSGTGVTSIAWNDTAPTSTVFTVGAASQTNDSGATFVAYLFATCAGVSKVGSYTGTATTKQIDCGFTAGARFVLIKRTDSTGDWYVWDSARGIIAGNDPYLLLNSTAAEVTSTDYIDTYSAGFEISSTAPAAINANGGSFIFLAIS